MGIISINYFNTIDIYPQLSTLDYGVSKFDVIQNVKYEVVINFTMIHNRILPQFYTFKVARLNDRQPNSILTKYCPPYQECEILFNNITGYDEINKGVLDKFNNSYDIFNTTLSRYERLTLNQKYNITLNEIKFNDIQSEDIGVYDFGDEIFTLYNTTEIFYECDNPSLVELSNSIVNPTDTPVEKAQGIFNWIVNNIEYKKQDEEIGALEAYNQGVGDCSDFSDLMITLLRIQSIPARKVTGFLITNNTSLRPKIGDQYSFDINFNGLTMSTFSSKKILGHAWVEYYVPKIGWIACDPTWGQGYFNRIDLFRFNMNIGAWFFVPGATPPYDRTSEFPINPSPICADHHAYDWQYSIEITVLETDLTSSPPIPIFVVIFIVIGSSVILLAIILSLRKGSKKKIFSY